jgi:hypothetical protein
MGTSRWPGCCWTPAPTQASENIQLFWLVRERAAGASSTPALAAPPPQQVPVPLSTPAPVAAVQYRRYQSSAVVVPNAAAAPIDLGALCREREARRHAATSASSSAALGQAEQEETQQASRAPPPSLARPQSAELLEQALVLSLSPTHSNAEGDGAGAAADTTGNSAAASASAPPPVPVPPSPSPTDGGALEADGSGGSGDSGDSGGRNEAAALVAAQLRVLSAD